MPKRNSASSVAKQRHRGKSVDLQRVPDIEELPPPEDHQAQEVVDETTEESEVEEDHEDDAASGEQSPRADEALLRAEVLRPQVWVRIKPTRSPLSASGYEISEDNQTLTVTIESEDRVLPTSRKADSTMSVQTDGILVDAGQEETYEKTTGKVVEKAMEGTSGIILSLGPEASGKKYTIFGNMQKFPARGIVPRALEKIFKRIEGKREEYEFHVILSMFEVRRDKIKDLLTLGPYNLKQVGEFGPKGLFFEEITSFEHGLCLLLRGITGQRLICRESFAKPHTIVYLDILSKSRAKLKREDGLGCTPRSEWRSRITFAQIAALPSRPRPPRVRRSNPENPYDCMSYLPAACAASPNCFELLRLSLGPVLSLMEGPPTSSSKEEEKDEEGDAVRKCCCRGPTGKLGESIAIRKDFSFLEQMFIRSCELRKIHDYYNKLQSYGMFLLQQPPKLAPSQYFRQNRLAHCLKDLVSSGVQVRILIHLRTEKNYLQSTLEALRFANRARCGPKLVQTPKNDEEDCDADAEEDAGAGAARGSKASRGRTGSEEHLQTPAPQVSGQSNGGEVVGPGAEEGRRSGGRRSKEVGVQVPAPPNQDAENGEAVGEAAPAAAGGNVEEGGGGRKSGEGGGESIGSRGGSGGSEQKQNSEDSYEMIDSAKKEALRAREFEDLKRIAREQVRVLTQAYPKRPPWTMYF